MRLLDNNVQMYAIHITFSALTLLVGFLTRKPFPDMTYNCVW